MTIKGDQCMKDKESCNRNSNLRKPLRRQELWTAVEAMAVAVEITVVSSKNRHRDNFAATSGALSVQLYQNTITINPVDVWLYRTGRVPVLQVSNATLNLCHIFYRWISNANIFANQQRIASLGQMQTLVVDFHFPLSHTITPQLQSLLGIIRSPTLIILICRRHHHRQGTRITIMLM